MSTKPDPHADPWSHVTTLAAGLVHEIKNPLSTISLNLQLLLEDWQQGAHSPRERRTIKRLQTLHRETTRLTGLLEDFLRYARTPEIAPQPCDLNALVQELLDFIAPKATQLGIQVRTDLALGLPAIQADPKLLKQAILNLLVNAEEAMPKGGELILRTSADAAGVQMDVTDTGVGIPDHQLGKVFDLYFSTKEGGSGLGLCTTRRILERHGGSIAVESDVGKGTHFTVRLPLAPPATEGTP
ncbi:MAG: two-component sensor histidine kinase [Planctomycetes bacterium]|nr:two-component sensor histidine kinase [Planctomycetota bacterium]